MNLNERLSNVDIVLEDNNFTLATYLSEVLARPDHPQHESVILNATPICQAICSIERNAVFSWAWSVVEDVLVNEICALSQKESGLHFNALQCTSKDLDGSFMKETSQKIRQKGPNIWRLMTRLLDANADLRRRIQPSASELDALFDDSDNEIFAAFDIERGLGGALEEWSGESEDTKSSTQRKKERNTALIAIVKSVLIYCYATKLMSK